MLIAYIEVKSGITLPQNAVVVITGLACFTVYCVRASARRHDGDIALSSRSVCHMHDTGIAVYQSSLPTSSHQYTHTTRLYIQCVVAYEKKREVFRTI